MTTQHTQTVPSEGETARIRGLRTVIIGGVAGGMSAATRLRRLDETAEIVVLERGGYVSFANCGLPYHIGGVIEDRAKLLLQSPEGLSSRFRLDVRVRTEAIRIDRAAQTVTVRDLDSGAEHEERYDRLILAPGAELRERQTIAGIPTHSLRSVEDVDAIHAALADAGDAPLALVLGGGFIGLEAAENLALRGATVLLLQHSGQLFRVLDPEMSTRLHDTMLEHGVEVRLNTTAVEAESRDGDVRLSDGSAVRPALIIDARGVVPAIGPARAAGIVLGDSGGIAVDGAHRTNDPNIFAVGDAVEKTDAVDGSRGLVTMAGLANRHGRAAADAIAGLPVEATPALGTSIIGLFGLQAAVVGHSETRLRADGRAHRVIHTHPLSHAGYYPGAEQIALKLMVDPETDLILGAQAVGRDGVDKRIDVIATAMFAGLTATQLTQLELAYAPQFGSAKDPINLIGYVNENLAAESRSVQWHEMPALRDAGAVLLDVRSPGEFAAGAIPGSINLPLDEIRERAGELPDAPLIVHCQVGQRGHTAAALLRQLGHDVSNLDGGFLTWRAGSAARERSTP
ncbi:FAD-dependent oxidoreductase [Leucobacter sp. M11]|uniref:FAD-dependent oxidoreductase n=1 Tax=Leucobacter sp. M11 TaxID=2993565 RepID=UPI002D7FDD0D|nr:FAD-dependent oxidoreductase [Leucobacter sp. M11]MEB4615513.1 FAD-dependent oxidoreductase [Leucobacter sp. M11]